MKKPAGFPSDPELPDDIPDEFRRAFAQEFDQYRAGQRGMETSALFSEDEVEQLNTAVETVAERLGFSGELAAIDTLLRLRHIRAARVLSAACSIEPSVP